MSTLRNRVARIALVVSPLLLVVIETAGYRLP